MVGTSDSSRCGVRRGPPPSTESSGLAGPAEEMDVTVRDVNLNRPGSGASRALLDAIRLSAANRTHGTAEIRAAGRTDYAVTVDAGAGVGHCSCKLSSPRAGNRGTDVTGSFSPSAVVDRAMSRTGLSDLGDLHLEPVLESWCADLASAALSEGGRKQLARQAERNLQTRLGIVDELKRHPEIHEVKLPRIARIMGFPRSGTTLLHNLMGRRVDARSLLRWELTAPLPPPEAGNHATDSRIGSAQRVVETLRGSELERMIGRAAGVPLRDRPADRSRVRMNVGS